LIILGLVILTLSPVLPSLLKARNLRIKSETKNSRIANI
jgi:hypothetical protein